ncbi:MAG: type III pantothenate kinase [Planctomycetaceae bacterium]|nr:type III pantothenate kinase [Planctomycetaceae bacterium]
MNQPPESRGILAIDIGNSRVKLGVFSVSQGSVDCLESTSIDRPRPGASAPGQSVVPQILHWARAKSQQTTDAPGLTQTRPTFHRCVLAGSVPAEQQRLAEEWDLEGCHLCQITSRADLEVPLDVDFPDRVGLDRVLNAYAARRLNPHRPTILCVSGTAITVDLVTSDGTFRGGCILPGMRLAAIALHEHTALLPLLDLPEEDGPALAENAYAPEWLTRLPAVPGRNTEAAMTAGLVLGQLGSVRELTQALQKAAQEQFDENTAPTIMLSGGSGRLLAAHLPNAQYIPNLTLLGLAFHGASLTR